MLINCGKEYKYSQMFDPQQNDLKKKLVGITK